MLEAIMANNKTNEREIDREERKGKVARWKSSKGAKREFLAVYNPLCALGAMLLGMAEGLLRYVLKDENETREALEILAGDLWAISAQHRGEFAEFVATRVEEAKNRRLEEDRSPTVWGERAERKTHLSGFFGTLRDVPVVRTTEGPNGEKAESNGVRMGRIAPEELQKLHSGDKALLGPARARLGDLMGALVALDEWKLVEELQRWAREELDLEEERRESLFRGMLSSLVSGDLATKFVNPLMKAVKEAGFLTKDGKVAPSRHRKVWGWMAEGLRSLEADLCVAFLEARGVEAQEEISWFLRRYAKELAKVNFMCTRQSVVMGKPGDLKRCLVSSGYWNLGGGGAAPFAGYRFTSTSPFVLFEAWKDGIVFQPPAEWGVGLAVLGALEGESVFAHAPSVFGSHGFKPVGAPLRWLSMQQNGQLRDEKAGWKWFQAFSRWGLPVVCIPPHFRKGDGDFFHLSESESAMGFRIAVETPVEGAQEPGRTRHSLPPLFADFLAQREAAIFQRISNDWKERAKGKDWSADWVSEMIQKDFEKEVAAKRPHLEASFGSQRGWGVVDAGDGEFDEFADHGDELDYGF